MAITPDEASQRIDNDSADLPEQLRNRVDGYEKVADEAFQKQTYERHSDDPNVTVLDVPIFAHHRNRLDAEQQDEWALYEMANALEGRFKRAGWDDAALDWKRGALRLTRRMPRLD